MSRSKISTIAGLFLYLTAHAAMAQTYLPVSALPDQDPISGRFMNLTRGFSSLGETGTQIELNIPVVDGHIQTDFVLSIFDGDVYNVVRDADGVSAFADGTPGYWDPVGLSLPASRMPQVTYCLYANPDTTSTPVLLQTWGSWEMPDGDWWATTIAHNPAAYNADLNCYQYCLRLDWEDYNAPVQTNAQNNFKIAVTGNLHLNANCVYGFIGYSSNDPAQYRFPGPTTYNGEWTFNLSVPQGTTQLELWNGDFDSDADTNDKLSPPTPSVHARSRGRIFPEPVVNGILRSQGSHKGAPADNAPVNSPLRMGDPISMKISSPAGPDTWSHEIVNPSGDREWEATFISSEVSDKNAHLTAPLPAGIYQWEIKGADGRNTLFLAANMDIVPANGRIGDRVWFDKNRNGLQDAGEAGVADVNVRLYTLDGQLMSEQVTDANGKYQFTNLPFATYAVEFVLPDGYRWTKSMIGADRAIDSDAAPLQGFDTHGSNLTDLSSNIVNLTHDAGLVIDGPDMVMELAANKLGVNTRNVSFWQYNLKKLLSKKPKDAHVSQSDMVKWIKAVRVFHSAGIFGSADALMKVTRTSDSALMQAAYSVLYYNNSSNMTLKLRSELMATELNMVSSLFSFNDASLLEAFCKRVEDALLSNPDTTTMGALRDLCYQINNEGTVTTTQFGLGRFVGYNLAVDAYDMAAGDRYSVTLPLDRGMTFVSATSGGAYDPATHSVKWSLAMPAGDSSFDLACATRISASAAGNVPAAGDTEGTSYSNWQTLATTIGDFITRSEASLF